MKITQLNDAAVLKTDYKHRYGFVLQNICFDAPQILKKKTTV